MSYTQLIATTMLAVVFGALIGLTTLSIIHRRTGLSFKHGYLSSLRGPSFLALRESLGPFLIDKTALIESLINSGMGQRVDLVLRPRRCGKSCMLHMLKAFFSLEQTNQSALFNGLYIGSKHDICRQHMGKYAVIFLDCMVLRAPSWEVMLSVFQRRLSILYREWKPYLLSSLCASELEDYQSIIRRDSSPEECKFALLELSRLLARRSGRGVIVLIDEYETPVSCASEFGYFPQANEYFGRGVFSCLLKGNKSLEMAVLAGVTPSGKSGWSNNIHPLHRTNSVYAGKVMFTEEEVLRLIDLSNSTLELREIKAQYNSYLAALKISVYNPVSVLSATEQDRISNYWVSTGEHPLIRRHVQSLDSVTIDSFTELLTGQDVNVRLSADVYFSAQDLDSQGILTLLYYAGYLTMTASGALKIPNTEVLESWSQWITSSEPRVDNIFLGCINGPVSSFVDEWPTLMQAALDTKLVTKEPGSENRKTPEKLSHLFVLGVLYGLRLLGREVHAETRAGSGYIDIRIVSRKQRSAALIEMKSSASPELLERDADRALEQIITQNYRNHHHLEGVDCIREYGMANFHLQSFVKGRYLARSRSAWVDIDDPVRRCD